MSNHIHKSSVQIRHDTRNHTVRIDQGEHPKYRLYYNGETGEVFKVERMGYNGWQEMKPDASPNVAAFWEAFQCLP